MKDILVQDSKYEPSSSFRRLLGPTIIVTLLTLASQGLGFLTQVVIAAAFGARADMDAFLAANTLPQYIIAILMSALSFVFIPVFIEYISTGRETEAWQIASIVTTLCMLVLGGIASIGMLFAGSLLRLTTPGLSPNSLRLANQVALITWPTVVITGLASLLTGIYQAKGRFGWPAAVPVIGSLVNLVLVVVLARPLGIIGLAFAASMNILLQAFLLSSILFGGARFHLVIKWDHPGVHQVLSLLWPLMFSGLLIRATPLVDRYLASGLGEGTISHLGYALKILGLLAMLISTGLTTVLFPRMAANMVERDMTHMRNTVSQGLRIMWLAVAPTICLGIVLALPAIKVLFQRGQFNISDAEEVAGLLQIYIVALVGMCLGNITGRGLYALKETRIVALISSFEAIGYVLYTPLLTRLLGASGVALSYVIYVTPGLVWSILLIRHKTGNMGGRTVFNSFLRTGLAALLGGVTAWGVTQFILNVWLQLALGGGAGLLAYGVGLWILRSSEIQQVWNIIKLQGRAETIVYPINMP